MKLQESIIIDRAIEIVWEHVQDPYYMKKWNPRLKNLIPLHETYAGLGYKYKAEYEMLGNTDLFNAEIVEYEKPKNVLIRYKNTSGRFSGIITERFYLKETTTGTKLCHYLDFEKSGLNIGVRILIYLHNHLGNPIRKGYLSQLKKNIEC